MAKAPIYEKDELIEILHAIEQKNGRRPKKSDIPPQILPEYRKAFGKWCYALEAAGMSVPSEETLARRNRHKTRHRHTSHSAAKRSEANERTQ